MKRALITIATVGILAPIAWVRVSCTTGSIFFPLVIFSARGTR
jgi:hypothetical protein